MLNVESEDHAKKEEKTVTIIVNGRQETGVNASTLTRIGQGADPDVDGLAALLAWANLKAEMFIPGSTDEEAEPIAKITALLRADPHLSKKHAELIEDIVVTTYNRLKDG